MNKGKTITLPANMEYKYKLLKEEVKRLSKAVAILLAHSRCTCSTTSPDVPIQNKCSDCRAIQVLGRE